MNKIKSILAVLIVAASFASGYGLSRRSTLLNSTLQSRLSQNPGSDSVYLHQGAHTYEIASVDDSTGGSFNINAGLEIEGAPKPSR